MAHSSDNKERPSWTILLISFSILPARGHKSATFLWQLISPQKTSTFPALWKSETAKPDGNLCNCLVIHHQWSMCESNTLQIFIVYLKLHWLLFPAKIISSYSCPTRKKHQPVRSFGSVSVLNFVCLLPKGMFWLDLTCLLGLDFIYLDWTLPP